MTDDERLQVAAARDRWLGALAHNRELSHRIGIGGKHYVCVWQIPGPCEANGWGETYEDALGAALDAWAVLHG